MIKKVLVTGASGLCGSITSQGLSKLGYKLTLCDIKKISSPAAKSLNISLNKKIKIIDLRNFSKVKKITKGMDAVVHFGGIPRHKPHEDVFQNIIDHNIIGTYNVFEACRVNKVKRIIFASSAHIMGYHDRKKRLDDKSSFRPDSHYAVSKCFGESLSKLYSDNKEAYRLGYKPLDNAENYSKDKLTKNEYKDKIALRLHGGVFTTDGLKGKLSNILKNK